MAKRMAAGSRKPKKAKRKAGKPGKPSRPERAAKPKGTLDLALVRSLAGRG